MTLIQEYGLENLSRDRMADLAQELWAKLEDDGDDLGLTPDQEAELVRRIADYEADPSNTVAWEEIEARHIARFGS